jgi:hypothetical protein
MISRSHLRVASTGDYIACKGPIFDAQPSITGLRVRGKLSTTPVRFVPIDALVLRLDHFRATRRRIAHPQDTPSLALAVGVHRRDNPLKILVAQ